MSDVPQGPGWWLASDGRYYPPENQSSPPPPPQQQANWQQPVDPSPRMTYFQPAPQVVQVKQRSGCFTVGLAIIGGFVVLFVVIGILAAIGNSDSANPDEDQGAPEEVIFPGRPDAQEKDQERLLGGTATINNLSATVTNIEFVQSLNSFQDEGYWVVSMTYTNWGEKAQPYNTFDWRFQTSNGQVIDPGFYDNTLGSGDLVSGGKVSGTVVFDADSLEGFIIWKPFAFDSDRGIWEVK